MWLSFLAAAEVKRRRVETNAVGEKHNAVVDGDQSSATNGFGSRGVVSPAADGGDDECSGCRCRRGGTKDNRDGIGGKWRPARVVLVVAGITPPLPQPDAMIVVVAAAAAAAAAAVAMIPNVILATVLSGST